MLKRGQVWISACDHRVNGAAGFVSKEEEECHSAVSSERYAEGRATGIGAARHNGAARRAQTSRCVGSHAASP